MRCSIKRTHFVEYHSNIMMIIITTAAVRKMSKIYIIILKEELSITLLYYMRVYIITIAHRNVSFRANTRLISWLYLLFFSIDTIIRSMMMVVDDGDDDDDDGDENDAGFFILE